MNNNMDNASVVPRSLPYHLLEEMTDGFAQDRELGGGTFGKVYLGLHKDGEKIAVKMLRPMLGLDDELFEKEYHNLESLQHPNIVRLVGYCHETRRQYVPYEGKIVLGEVTHRALCFEYMQNGSLDCCISDESSGHDWQTRYAIIKGICKGLKYLHEELKPPIFHLDLKPANVLLDENKVPKIADFGLSRLIGEERTRVTTSSIGTIGYLPPEYIYRHVISNKSDIFSLGVMIIKIMAGPMGYSRSADISSQEFIDLVHGNWRNRLQAASTSALESYCEQIKRCIAIALSCVEFDRHKRPTIGDILNELNETETMSQLPDALGNDPGSSVNETETRSKFPDARRNDPGSLVYETETMGKCPDAFQNDSGSSVNETFPDALRNDPESLVNETEIRSQHSDALQNEPGSSVNETEAMSQFPDALLNYPGSSTDKVRVNIFYMRETGIRQAHLTKVEEIKLAREKLSETDQDLFGEAVDDFKLDETANQDGGEQTASGKEEEDQDDSPYRIGTFFARTGTLCQVYNVTGHTLYYVDNHTWHGQLNSGPYPEEIGNGQWATFFHAHSRVSGFATAAVVYRGKNIYAEDHDYLLAWSGPLSVFYRNKSYCEIGAVDNFETRWRELRKKLANSDYSSNAKSSGCEIQAKITRGQTPTFIARITSR